MSKKIKLYWWQHKEGQGNFGDELNPYIIERLIGSEIQWTGSYNGFRWNSIKTIAYLFLKEKLKVENLEYLTIIISKDIKLFNKPFYKFYIYNRIKNSYHRVLSILSKIKRKLIII